MESRKEKHKTQLENLFLDLKDSFKGQRARRFFEATLELVRPLHLSWGVRISRLSTTYVEFVVPCNSRTLALNQEIDLGVLASAAQMATHLFLRRADLIQLGRLNIKKIEIEKLTPLDFELRGRLAFSPLQQETLRVDLLTRSAADFELPVQFFSQGEKLAATVKLSLECQVDLSLGWKGSAS